MKKAIVSVSDKKDITNLVNNLILNDYEIITTGGTYKKLIERISPIYSSKIIKVEDFTNFPEILEGRVKTLHPKIYGGILFDKDNEKHKKDFTRTDLQLQKIDLVVVNLYPFSDVISKEVSEEEAIENIDIGGVTLLRAAAKNYKNVTVLTDPKDYFDFIKNIETVEKDLEMRKYYASKAFELVTKYDECISSWFNPNLNYRKYEKVQDLKYGCNPYQKEATLCKKDTCPIEVLYGTPGYINYLDAIHSWCLVTEAQEALKCTVAASFKHTTPAGVATCKYPISDKERLVYDLENFDLKDCSSGRAFIRARNCDPLSSFGDFIAISGIVDETTALLIRREVSDGIIAEDYTSKALEILRKKKMGKFIILRGDKNLNLGVKEYREIFGIVLSQRSNSEKITEEYLKNIVTKNTIMPQKKREDLILATITLKYTPSNSIVIANKSQVIGVGAGQQNRVDCVKIAGNKSFMFNFRFHPKVLDLMERFKSNLTRQEKTNCIIKYISNDFTEEELVRWLTNFKDYKEIELLSDKDYLEKPAKGLSLSSDAFFPFRDNIDYAFRFGVDYILNPGGSISDHNVISACDEYNICMAISEKRLFLH